MSLSDRERAGAFWASFSVVSSHLSTFPRRSERAGAFRAWFSIVFSRISASPKRSERAGAFRAWFSTVLSHLSMLRDSGTVARSHTLIPDSAQLPTRR